MSCPQCCSSTSSAWTGTGTPWFLSLRRLQCTSCGPGTAGTASSDPAARTAAQERLAQISTLMVRHLSGSYGGKFLLRFLCFLCQGTKGQLREGACALDAVDSKHVPLISSYGKGKHQQNLPEKDQIADCRVAGLRWCTSLAAGWGSKQVTWETEAMVRVNSNQLSPCDLSDIWEVVSGLGGQSSDPSLSTVLLKTDK